MSGDQPSGRDKTPGLKAPAGPDHTGHRKRLREKFSRSGLDGFHDYEVIELLLTLATPRKDCKQAAKRALRQFKTLPAVFEASTAALCQIDGIGPKNAFGIKLIRAVADRYVENRIVNQNPLSNAKALFDYLKIRIRDKKTERFESLFLDAKNRVLGTETLFKGTLTASTVYPREVIRAALAHNAAAVIFAHNHPSGDPVPSEADHAITRQLVFACRIMGITVHEHLVMGANGYYSFADQGHIARLNREFSRIP